MLFRSPDLDQLSDLLIACARELSQYEVDETRLKIINSCRLFANDIIDNPNDYL